MKRSRVLMTALGLFLVSCWAVAGWTPAQRITWNSGASESPALAVDSLGNLHVVWNDDTPGNEEIYYKMSKDGGTSWTAA